MRAILALASLRRGWCALAGLALLGSTGCATLPIPAPNKIDQEAAYTRVHPYYIEFCALSELLKKPGYGVELRGGIGGHSTIYLNGVCVQGPGYPEIGVCADAPAGKGVGLSVNSHFVNANWVPIPGRDFFYHGDLQPGQTLTRAIYDATKAHAQRLGLYDAIRYHDWVFADMPRGASREAFKYEIAIATDYAIGYGRDRYCARVPVSAAQMARITAYLNGLNRPYRDGEAEYEWNVFNDNCIHVAHNALTGIGFWPLWPMHQPVLLAAFDFPVPKNEFVNIMRRANDMKIDDLLAMWHNLPVRRALLADEGLPTRPGALAVFERMAQQNEVYDTDPKLIFYDDPVFGPYEGWYRRIASQPRYTDLAANTQYFQALYARIGASRRPLAWWQSNHPALAAQPDFQAFYARYYAAMAQDTAF